MYIVCDLWNLKKINQQTKINKTVHQFTIKKKNKISDTNICKTRPHLWWASRLQWEISASWIRRVHDACVCWPITEVQGPTADNENKERHVFLPLSTHCQEGKIKHSLFVVYSAHTLNVESTSTPEGKCDKEQTLLHILMKATVF